ncbi:uncharacterized protein LOC132378059 isoform X3 [Hypanus sabinus]|uniref:uncharacterized protein LOC132378059 isoform X3 n=1 Tax=Hypanus sabinus TaxID=79690 RepID=UPI0028C3A1F7|nr:uncharacterized protein LOC132378059 isoform X3 [Hypanus sabinus]
MVMEHPDVQWTWLHVIFCSSIIQTTAVSLHAKSDLSSGGNTIYIYSTKAVHVGNSNPPGSSPQSLPEISSKVSAHEEPDPPIHSGMSPLYLSASSRGNSSDFSGDDEDLVFDDEDLVFNSEDNSNIEEVKQDITESQAFILGNGSVPSVISADTNSSSDYSLLKPFNSTSVYKSTQSVQNPKHSQGSGTVHDISFLQHSTATFPNDDLFFEVNSHHMTLPHTETMQTTPRPLVALGNMNPTLTSDHLVTEKPYFITTSYVSPGEETPVPEIKRNHDQVLTPLVIESSAKWPQDFVSKKLSVNHMSPAPMRSASPLITGSSYSAMMSEKLLIVSRPAADVSELHNRTDTFSRANTIDANAQFFAQRASNSVEHLPKLTTTPASERQVRWQTTDRAYPRVKVLSATDRMSTSQWVRMSAYDTDKFLPSQQTTQTYFTSEQGNDIYTNPVDSSATVIEMVEDPQFLDGQPTNTKQGSVVRGSFPNGLATISPTARLQHLTLKGNRNVLSSIEPTRVVTTTYFSPLTAWRHGPSREPNSAIESAKTESIPSGRYMAMLKTRPTVLTQQLTAKISNKTNVSVTLPPLTQGGLGTKSISTTLSLPRATTKVPLPSSRPTKVSIAETTMKGGPVKVGVKPPFKDTVTEGTLPSATRTPGNHYNVITTVTAVTRSQSVSISVSRAAASHVPQHRLLAMPDLGSKRMSLPCTPLGASGKINAAQRSFTVTPLFLPKVSQASIPLSVNQHGPRINPLHPPGMKRRTVSLETFAAHHHNQQRALVMRQKEYNRHEIRQLLKWQMNQRWEAQRFALFKRAKEGEEAREAERQAVLQDLEKQSARFRFLQAFRDENKKLMEMQWKERRLAKSMDCLREREMLQYNPINWSGTLK